MNNIKKAVALVVLTVILSLGAKEVEAQGATATSWNQMSPRAKAYAVTMATGGAVTFMFIDWAFGYHLWKLETFAEPIVYDRFGRAKMSIDDAQFQMFVNDAITEGVDPAVWSTTHQ